MSVFIREVTKGKKVEKMASFPVDIPGSLSRVIAQQHQDEADGKKGGGQYQDKNDPLSSGTGLEDEDDDDDDMGDDLLKDVGDEDKNEASLLGIETDEDEDEEE